MSLEDSMKNVFRKAYLEIYNREISIPLAFSSLKVFSHQEMSSPTVAVIK